MRKQPNYYFTWAGAVLLAGLIFSEAYTPRKMKTIDIGEAVRTLVHGVECFAKVFATKNRETARQKESKIIDPNKMEEIK